MMSLIPTRATSPLIARLGLLLASFFALGCPAPEEESTARSLEIQPQEAQTPTGPPTAMRLVIELEADTFRLVSVSPRRGTVLRPAIDENMASILEGNTLLVQYTGRDAANQVLFTDRFLLPITAEVEHLDPNVRHRIQRGTETLQVPGIRVAIPYDSTLVAIDFERLEPNEGVPVERWEVRPLNRVFVALRTEEGDEPNRP